MKTRAFTFGSDAVVQSTCRVQAPIISHDIKDLKGPDHAEPWQESETYPCWNRTRCVYSGDYFFHDGWD